MDNRCGVEKLQYTPSCLLKKKKKKETNELKCIEDTGVCVVVVE